MRTTPVRYNQKGHTMTWGVFFLLLFLALIFAPHAFGFILVVGLILALFGVVGSRSSRR